MPVQGAARFHSGILCCVPVQALREAVSAARLRFTMLRAMLASTQSLKSGVMPVATNVALAGHLSRSLEKALCGASAEVLRGAFGQASIAARSCE